jgi:hypothetical protein
MIHDKNSITHTIERGFADDPIKGFKFHPKVNRILIVFRPGVLR